MPIPQAPTALQSQQQFSSGVHDDFIEEGLVPAENRTSKKKAKKSRRVVKSDEAAVKPETVARQEPNYVPVDVEIDAPFGRLRQMFSGIFRDGGNLVLWTDQRKLPAVYTLPEVTEPMILTITWQQRITRCIWAGIQFTMPNAPITFTVLLIDEVADSSE